MLSLSAWCQFAFNRSNPVPILSFLLYSSFSQSHLILSGAVPVIAFSKSTKRRTSSIFLLPRTSDSFWRPGLLFTRRHRSIRVISCAFINKHYSHSAPILVSLFASWIRREISTVVSRMDDSHRASIGIHESVGIRVQSFVKNWRRVDRATITSELANLKGVNRPNSIFDCKLD